MMNIIYYIAAEAAPSDYSTNLPHAGAGHNQLQQILQIVFGVLAAVAVLMIVIAGLRFVTADGNPQEVSKAKGTIVYALVGLLIAISAEAIITLTLSHL